MIQATFIRRQGFLESAELTGHAGAGEYGFDIVCAAVSTLSINFVNSLEVLTDCPFDYEVNEGDGGYMKVDLSKVAQRQDEKVQLLFEAFLLGISNLATNASAHLTLSEITA